MKVRVLNYITGPDEAKVSEEITIVHVLLAACVTGAVVR